MTGMEILNRCRDALTDIEQLEQMIAQRRETLKEICDDQSDPVGSGLLDEISDLEKRLKNRKNAQKAENVAACALIDHVHGLGGRILYGYYVRGLTAEKVAKDEHYTAAYIRRLKRKCEEIITEIPEDRIAAILPKWYEKKERKVKKDEKETEGTQPV